MTEWAQPRERAEWTHPRRAAKEIISYLSQVETVIDQYAQDDHSYGGDGEEDDVGRDQMMDNILEELKHQTASIMEDRQGSVVAEKMARRLTPLQLRTMLGRCRGYMLSLANNRYSSHVLQTLLSIAGQVVEAELSEDSDDDDDDAHHSEADQGSAAATDSNKKVDKMQDILLALVSELSGAWAELLADISGSHVGRGFLQVLGGMPILSEKRGRQSRHAHSIGTAVGPMRIGGRKHNNGSSMVLSSGAKSNASTTPAIDPEALEKWSTPYRHRVPRSFVAALGEVTSELAALPASELQTLACGTFGCPLLVMLLRVHGNLATAATATRGDGPASSGDEVMVLPCLEQESTAMRIVMKVLEWHDEEQSAQVVYAISGENTASHFLEAVLWLSPRSFFEELYHRCFESKLLEFCEHSVSNFLIQAALQRVDDKALAETMVGAISDNASELLKLRRAGVLWRAAQACVRLRLNPKTQTKLLEDIALAVQAGHTGVPAPPPTPATSSGDTAEVDPKTGDNGAAASSPTADAFKAARAWVPALLSPRLPGEGGLNRLSLNVPGARIVQNALLFDPPVAAPVLKAVAALPEDVLAAVARDNVGSRCLLDPILEAAGTRGGGGGKGKNKPAEDARRSVLRAFRGHLVAMACDRVAWHILLKCFRGVDMKEKRAIAEELAAGGQQAWSRMSGYPSGRSVLTECMVERFSRSPHEWEDAFKNRDNRAKMLTEILAVESASAKRAGKADKAVAVKNGGTSSANGSSHRAVGLAPSPFDKSEPAEDEGKGKEKRRRQRGRGRRGKASGAGEAAADADGGEEEGGGVGSGDAPEPVDMAATTNKGKEKISKKARKDGGVEAEKARGVDDDAAATSKTKDTTERNGSGAEGESGVEDTTREVPKKKKKRKRQEGADVDGVKAAGDTAIAGDKEEKKTDLSFVMDAIKKSVSASDSQAPSPTGGKRSGKKKRDRGVSGTDSGGGQGAENAASSEVGGGAAEETPATVAVEAGGSTGSEISADPKDGNKKKNSKKKRKDDGKPPVEEESKWKAMETPPKRKGAGVVAVEAKAAESSGKKRKKSGFRLF